LLSIRDGEPIDAAARARVLEDPESAAEIERLRAVQRQLRGLPELAPPPGAWEAIAARTAVGPRRGRRFARLAAGGAIAATVAVAALLVLSRPQGGGEPPPAEIAGPVQRAVQPFVPPQLPPPSVVSLEQRSAELERLLAQLPRRSVMRASTAGTIAGLEDRITFIDTQLTLGAARGMPPPQKEALWQARVDLMSALVYVRYAQAEGGGF